MKRTKLFNTKASSIDEESKTIKFKISDNQPDRMNEIVDQSWQTKNYMANPVILWGHDPDEPENVLGNALSIETAGTETYATVRIDEDINPKAGLIWKQLLRGTLRCVSVGFINHSEEIQDDRLVLKDNELLEISIVAIPANPRAIALAYKEGSINKKDAQWLMDSMRKEAQLLEAQLKSESNNDGEKTVEELKQQISDLTATVNKLTESQAASAEKLDNYIAAQEKAKTDAEAEAKAKAEKEEAERKAKEEQDAKNTPAKPGDDDQGGAGGGDDFDDEAEITPEEQAEIDAELENSIEN